ncbi:MAG: Replication factor C small subunit [Methanomassiliicoccales archaeon PtaU1.Bin124]|nr:MAG: Replication factor C small subunit [Methanomassiliicoccales archaeon PtaU1.Bin124]
MQEIWIEKYRPKKLDDIVGQKDIVDRLKAYARAGNLPHLMFAGPAGTGKTTSALALARELFKESWRDNFVELNASDERGIDVVRGKIKEFARTQPLGGSTFKIIFLDEADALTSDAQAALRRTMERYSSNCRFILSCNYSSKIIEPIQSRCAVFRFRPLKAEDIKAYLRAISHKEKIEITDEALDALVHVGEGDMRRAVNSLQVAAASEQQITLEVVYQTSGNARPEEVIKMLETALNGNFVEARALLDEIMLNYGLSGEDIIKQIHRSFFDLNIPDVEKVRLIDKTGEVEFRLVEGSNERIQLEALLAYLVLVGERA